MHGHDSVAVHGCLQGFSRLDLNYDYVCSQTLGAHGKSPAAPAVAGHDHGLAREEEVGGLHDAVQSALAGAVAVVEHHLGLGVVDGDDRIEQSIVLGHGPQAHDTGGGLLAAAEHLRGQLRLLLVDDGDGIGSVVQTDVGLKVQGFLDAVVVLLLVLAPEGVDVEAPRRQGRSHFILRGQRIGAGDGHLGAAGHQSGDEVGRLHCDMQAGHDARALEGLFPLELLFDLLQNGHVSAGPFDALFSFCGEAWIFDYAFMQNKSP